jgi:hypothetical protein
MYLLDTNVVSEPIKPQPRPSVMTWLGEQRRSELFVSVITLGEIANGIERLQTGAKRDRLSIWQDTLEATHFAGRVLLVTRTIAVEWGRLEARYGRTLARLDALIGATALLHDLTIVTRNTRDFVHLPVRVFNPWLA